MITSIDIRNFRCFSHLSVSPCRRINVLVGDNGTGKTALLEAVFLTLGGNMDISTRLRAMRGLGGSFMGPPRAIEEAIWRDYFHNLDWNRGVSIDLTGSGPEARSMTISRGKSGTLIAPDSTDPIEATFRAPLEFTWKNANGMIFSYSPKIDRNGVQLDDSNEDLPDFFFIAANQTISAAENANQFSALSKAQKARQFIELFTKEFDQIEDLGIEVTAGSAVIHATIRGIPEKIPLNNVSGGMNRIASIVLPMASRPHSVVLVDEMENGIYHKHHQAFWRAVIDFARKFDSQLIATTHNEEWLEALFEVAGDDVDDIALWRMERSTNNIPVVRQFSGRQASAAVRVGEVR